MGARQMRRSLHAGKGIKVFFECMNNSLMGYLNCCQKMKTGYRFFQKDLDFCLNKNYNLITVKKARA